VEDIYLSRSHGNRARLPINLARGWRPLLRVPDTIQLRLGDRSEAFEEWTRSPVALTDAGLRVLSGSEDHVRLNGIDRWLVGIHLQGAEAAWRRDPIALRLVPMARSRASSWPQSLSG